MPFVNRRYYMNPLFGAAVERARGETNDSRAVSESLAPHLEPVAEMSDPPEKQGTRSPLPKAQEHKAEVGYGETAGLLPQKSPHAPANASPYDRRTWDSHSAAQLRQARANIMDISDRNVHRARPAKDTISQDTWHDNMQAAAKSDGALPGHYIFIRQEGVGLQRPPKRYGWGQGKPIHTYGPFRNVGGGDVPKGNHTYIDICNH
ncbi:MAG: hypothetical protein WBE20_07190 [Candidatus Acidiferrales bacterium]